MTLLLAFGVVAMGLFIALGRVYGYPGVAVSVFLLSVALTPKDIASGFTDVPAVDIAPPQLALSTYLIILAPLALLAFFSAIYWPSKPILPLSAIAFVLSAGVLLVFVWDGTPRQIAGTGELLLGVAAWAVGAYLGPLLVRHAASVRLVAMTILAIAAIQAFVAMLQRAGFQINPVSGPEAAVQTHRSNGLINHPNNLGKICWMLLLLCLALLNAPDRHTKRWLIAGITVLFIPLGLSQGRAVLAAVVMTLIIWSMLTPSVSASVANLRVAVPVLAVLVLLPFVGSFITRQEEDPSGGPRSHLTQTAYAQIGLRPLQGTGPNSYVYTVGPYDSLVAKGYPVHNAVLLTVAEIGAIAALLFWYPVLSLAWASWRARKADGWRGSFAVMIVASVPGMIIINATGWAMLSTSLLPMWFFLLGMAFSQVASSPRVVRDDLAAAPRAWEANRSRVSVSAA